MKGDFFMALLTCLNARYTLRQKLSHKAGRQTFLAEDLQTQTLVIVKIMQLGQTSAGPSAQRSANEEARKEAEKDDDKTQWTALKLFEREAKILRHLAHPAIPQYKDYFETEIEGVHSFVLVQTYIDAPSLESIVQAGRRFSQTEVVSIAAQLLQTLAYLHQQLPPVIHRDIKPSNILLSTHANGTVNRVYLIDFGAVQITATKDSGTVTIVGSYGYMPLEQFSGKTTAASDLYSLGMTLIYLMTGTHPAEMPQVNGQVQVQSIATKQAVSDRFIHWLTQLTHPYADHRIESAAIALTTLTSQDDSAGYYPHLKPKNSRVALYRTRNEIKIVTHRHTPIRQKETVCVPLFLLSSAVGVGSFGAIGLFLAFIPLLLWIAVIIGYQGCIKHVFKQYAYKLISIDRSMGIQIGAVRGRCMRALTHKKGSQIAPFKSISHIIYSPRHRFEHCYQKGKKDVIRRPVILPPDLSLYANNQKYSINNAHLSPAELKWIGQELSDFLNIPLQIIAPTDVDGRRLHAQGITAQPAYTSYSSARHTSTPVVYF